MTTNKTNLIIAAAAILALLPITSFAKDFDITSRQVGKNCNIYVSNKLFKAIKPGQSLTWLQPSQKSLIIDGKTCDETQARFISPAADPLLPGKVSGNQKTVVFLWLGYQAIVKPSLKEVSAKIQIPKVPPIVPGLNSTVSLWLGLQPGYNSLVTTQLGGFVLQPVLGWSSRFLFDNYQAQNMLCASSGLGICPSGQQAIPKRQDKYMNVALKHHLSRKGLPSYWESSWELKNSQTKAMMIFPDATISYWFNLRNISRYPLPVGLVQMEYQIYRAVRLDKLIDAFPKDKSIHFKSVKSISADGKPVKWEKAMSLTGRAFPGQNFSSMAQLKIFLQSQKHSYMYLNCMRHLLAQMKRTKTKTANGYTLSWTMPQHNPQECHAIYYKKLLS